MKPQTKRVLRHLEIYGKITPMRAWELCGVYRLSARIYELRKAGYNIVKEHVQVFNRYGEKCRVAEYRLESGNE